MCFSAVIRRRRSGPVRSLSERRSGQRQPDSHVRRKVNARPDARLSCFIRQCVQCLGISWKQIAERCRSGTRQAAVCRRIARTIWARKNRRQRWIELERPYCPVGIFGIPARHGRIVYRDAVECVGARSLRGIRSKAVLQNLLVRLFVPEPVVRAPPEPYSQNRASALVFDVRWKSLRTARSAVSTGES